MDPVLHLTWEGITAQLGSFLWPFLRIGTALGIAPVLGARTLPMRVRIGLALILSMIVAPLLPPAPAISPWSPEMVVLVLQQILIGMAFGLALMVVFSAMILGGQIIAMQSGLGFASLIDPVSGVQTPVVSQIYVVMATLVFFSLNGHLAMISSLVDSFRVLPVDGRSIRLDGVWSLLLWTGEIFRYAVRIALPGIATLLLVNLALGVITRAAPQLNIFSIGFPVIIMIGLAVISLTLPSAMVIFNHMLDAVWLFIHQAMAVSRG
ncbi:MAG TPA: flagellar biosynthetic protein FliR [Gammaproteobacteria bacterium]|nr:flagellar biosynthetic protein FliR [Gammaproteobacteria bacterium]